MNDFTGLPALVVTIDTEEEGLWSKSYRSHGNTVENLKGIPRFQELCDRYRVHPTYLIDSPVADDEFGADLLSRYQREGRAEVGAHLHPWCTPPFEEELCSRNSYICNLPVALQRTKLENLTVQIEKRCGRRPTSFRAGRYGIDKELLPVLCELGYIVDSSVHPFADFSHAHGPNFSSAPWKRYWMSLDDLYRSSNERQLLQIPVGAGFNRCGFEAIWNRRQALSRPPWKHFRLVGILDRLGFGRRIKLSPEQATGTEMIRLIQNGLADGCDTPVLMFHSSSLVPGMSPYVKDGVALEQFFQRLREVFEFWASVPGSTSPTMTSLAISLKNTKS